MDNTEMVPAFDAAEDIDGVIEALETEFHQIRTEIFAIDPPDFSEGSCTNGCTDNCTHGCTNSACGGPVSV